MNILTRYLFKEILQNFRLFLILFTVILLVNVIYDVLGDVLKESPPVSAVVLYLVYSVPGLLAQTFPMVCLMSTIFSYGLLAKNKEILAMVASGISFYRLALPALIFGLILTGFMFWFTESVVPACATQATYLFKVVIKHQKESVLYKKGDQFIKGKGGRFYYMEQYVAGRREMLNPTIFDVSASGNGLTQRIEADRAQIVQGKAGETSNSLRLFNSERWAFHPDGTLAGYKKITEPLQIPMAEENLDVFLTRTKKAEEMNYSELREFIHQREELGDDVRSYKTPLELKLSFPLSCLLMALLGFSVVADVHARHFAKGVTLGLLVAIGFYVLNAFFTRLGRDGIMPPIAAGWLPTATFVITIAVLMKRLQKIRG